MLTIIVSVLALLVANHNVYDSARTGDLSMDALESIATIINCQKRNIYLLFPEVQQQTDGFSCGLFTLAYICLYSS